MLMSVCVVWYGVLSTPLLAADRAEKKDATPVTYDQVRPTLKKHCVTCHNADRPRGDLDLSSIGAIKAGSGSGPVAVVGKPDESPLFTMPAHLEEPFMPPNSPKIPQRELDLLHRWILGGLREKGEAPGNPSPSVAAVTKPSASLIHPLPQATAITALAVSPVAPLAAVSGRGQAILLSLEEKKAIRAIEFPEGDVTALRFSRDGSALLIGGGVAGQSGKVLGVDVATSKPLFELGDEADTVLAVDLSTDKQFVALGGPGRTVKLFRTADGEKVATLKKHTDWILAVAFSPDGLLLASSDRFGGVQVWETESGEPLHTLRGHTGPVSDLAWSSDSDRLLTASQDGTLRWWDMHRGTALSQWDGGVGGVLTVAISSQQQVICGGRQRRVTVADATGKPLRQVTLKDEVAKLGVTGDGKFAVTGDAAGNVILVSLTTEAAPIPLSLPIDSTLVRRPTPVLAKRTAALPAKPIVLEATASSPDDPSNATNDLAAARRAAAQAEAAVKSAEEALARARETAKTLQAMIREREAAVQKKSSN